MFVQYLQLLSKGMYGWLRNSFGLYHSRKDYVEQGMYMVLASYFHSLFSLFKKQNVGAITQVTSDGFILFKLGCKVAHIQLNLFALLVLCHGPTLAEAKPRTKLDQKALAYIEMAPCKNATKPYHPGRSNSDFVQKFGIARRIPIMWSWPSCAEPCLRGLHGCFGHGFRNG